MVHSLDAEDHAHLPADLDILGATVGKFRDKAPATFKVDCAVIDRRIG